MDLLTRHTQNKFDWWAIMVLTVTVFLLPFFVVPTPSLPVQFTKTLIVFFGVLLAAILYMLARLKDGTLMVPRSYLLLSVWFLPLAYGMSALLSGSSFSLSFTGRQFEVDTFAYIAIAALGMTLVALLFKEKEHILRAYFAFVAAFIIVALYQGVRLLVGADTLSFGIFTDGTGNLVGKWNDFGIFLGFIAVLSLITLESLTIRAVPRLILYALLVVSLAFSAVVNFTPVWYMLAIFALGFFMASIMRSMSHSEHGYGEAQITNRGMKQISVVSLMILTLSVLFIFTGTRINAALTDYFGIAYLEARPSWQSTIDIGKQTMGENVLFGSGPNTFVEQWLKYKEVAINATPFWNIDFIAGIGLIPTSFVTTGVVGGFAWVIFLLVFFVVGIRSMLRVVGEDPLAYFAALVSFLSAAYFWVLSIVYVPNVVILTFAFVTTGFFVAALRHYPSTLPDMHILFARDSRMGFVTVFTFTLFLLAAFGSLYGVGVRYLSAASFEQARIEGNNPDGSIANAKVLAQRAIDLANIDQYHVYAASLRLAEMNRLARKGEGAAVTEAEKEDLREEFQNNLAQAVAHARAATEANPSNYQNWLMLGNVYSSVVLLNLEGAAANAKSAYETAQKLAPRDPSIALTLAQLAALSKDSPATKQYLEAALALKPNYLDAIFLKAQIALNEGEVKAAITSVESAAVFEPSNPVIFYQLGLLYYGDNQIAKAGSAFAEAVRLNGSYSNARYFLGLSLYQLKDVQGSIEQFKEVQKLNPDNAEVSVIINNLESGRSPLPQSAPNPVTSSPSQPVEEGV